MNTALTTWNPFREMENMNRRLAAFLDGGPRRIDGDETMAKMDWTPTVDVSEDDTAYLIKAELPEMKKEDVNVRIENGVLTLSGERHFEKEEKERKYHRVERAYGAFARSFVLPENVEHETASAEYRDGVLTVTVKKSEEAKPRQIEVKVG